MLWGDPMNKNLELFLTFMKIGAFTFGGGYAMIPLIQREVCDNKQWLNIGKQISWLFPLRHSRFVKAHCRIIIKYRQGKLCQLYCKLVQCFHKVMLSPI